VLLDVLHYTLSGLLENRLSVLVIRCSNVNAITWRTNVGDGNRRILVFRALGLLEGLADDLNTVRSWGCDIYIAADLNRGYFDVISGEALQDLYVLLGQARILKASTPLKAVSSMAK